MSAGGGKEIHFDSSALRAQYDGGGTAQVPITDSAYVPEIVNGNLPTPKQLAENIPADVLEAMSSGKPVTPEMIARMQGLAAPGPAQPRTHVSQPFFPSVTSQSQPQSAAVELTIPVGNGVTARVTFTSQPARIHWRKLIRHLEIEAEDADESVSTQAPDLVALADAALQRASRPAPVDQTTPPRTPRRRGRAKAAQSDTVETGAQETKA